MAILSWCQPDSTMVLLETKCRLRSALRTDFVQGHVERNAVPLLEVGAVCFRLFCWLSWPHNILAPASNGDLLRNTDSVEDVISAARSGMPPKALSVCLLSNLTSASGDGRGVIVIYTDFASTAFSAFFQTV